MSEHPILFSAPMIRAILDGRKTVTRRIVTPQPDHPRFRGMLALDDEGVDLYLHDSSLIRPIRCPYGKSGDALWVREECSAEELSADTEADRALDGLDGVRYAADGHFEPIENTAASADAWGALHAYRSLRGAIVPSIHMPRWASRITLRIADVRVERLQDITEDDAAAEGCSTIVEPDGSVTCGRRKSEFRDLWDSLNAKRGAGWDTNPWVWRIEFERVEPKP